MSSSSSRRLLATAALAFALAAGAAAEEPRVVVGLLPSGDPAVTAELVRGARLAFETSKGAHVALLVGESGERWSTVASEAVRLATRERAFALITPPDRDRAHLIAQVGTRGRVPVVSTSPAASITAAGSKWVVSVVRTDESTPVERTGPPTAPRFDVAARAARSFRTAFRKRYGRGPRAWEAVGYDAARALLDGLRPGATKRADLVRTLHARTAIAGAAGSFRIDASGRRVPVPHRPPDAP